MILRDGKYTLHLFPGSETFLYINGDPQTVGEIAGQMKEPPTFIAIDGVDWEDELTPWEAPKAFRGGKNFTGNAPRYLAKLTENLVPMAEKALNAAPRKRILAGYSLAGLFALWSAFYTTDFDCFASVSGSLWYDGFMEFLQQSVWKKQPQKIYLSVGERESATKNSRMASIGRKTEEVAAMFRTRGTETLFTVNAGGHFDNVSERLKDAFLALR